MIDNTYLVDTRYLRDLVLKLREDKKIASQLYENIAVMRNLDDPEVSQKYNSLLYEINQLNEYFKIMADTLDMIEQEAVILSSSIKNIINSDAETVNKISSESILL